MNSCTGFPSNPWPLKCWLISLKKAYHHHLGVLLRKTSRRNFLPRQVPNASSNPAALTLALYEFLNPSQTDPAVDCNPHGRKDTPGRPLASTLTHSHRGDNHHPQEIPDWEETSPSTRNQDIGIERERTRFCCTTVTNLALNWSERSALDALGPTDRQSVNGFGRNGWKRAQSHHGSAGTRTTDVRIGAIWIRVRNRQTEHVVRGGLRSSEFSETKMYEWNEQRLGVQTGTWQYWRQFVCEVDAASGIVNDGKSSKFELRAWFFQRGKSKTDGWFHI